MNERIKAIMKQFTDACPELNWDRYMDYLADNDKKVYAIYGWIKRKDGDRDFLVISFYDDENLSVESVWYTTSSAKYSKAFCDVVKSPVHVECKNVVL